MSILDPAASGTQAVDQTVPPAATPAETATVPEWIKELPEPLRAEKGLHKFKDRDALAASYVELQRKLGTSVHIPKDESDAAEWEKLFSRLRPESPDKYELPAEGFTEEDAAALKKTAYENGLSAKQAKALASLIADSEKKKQTATLEGMKSRSEEASSVLKQEYGKDFDGNLELARKALTHLFPGATEKLSGSGLDDNPAFIRGLVSLGKRLGEDSFISGAPPAKKVADPYDWMKERFKNTEE